MNKPRALLSVFDKTGIADLAKALVSQGYELLSTGGTLRSLEQAGLPVTAVSDATGSPEILGGRVKTLHPNIHGGILAKREDAQLAELDEHDITLIDVVVVNLYPFREATASGADLDGALENIDIGGPTMLRAAAKNFPSVLVIVDPDDYGWLADRLPSVDAITRQQLAAKAFAHVAAYDAAITRYLSDAMPATTALEVAKIHPLRYGENPHQQASLWRLSGQQGAVIDADVLQGKAMSFNNYQDADAAWRLLQDLAHQPAVVALKHANPCGVARADDLVTAYRRAHDADPQSIFGGIVALNQTVDADVAAALTEIFLEIVIAPDFTEAALSVFANKKNLRVLKAKDVPTPAQDVRYVAGGVLIQDADRLRLADAKYDVVTQHAVAGELKDELELAWHVVKHAKSNAIVLVKNGVTVGIGSGQVSRIGAAKQALEQAGDQAQGAVMASDAFFPFDDVVREAAAAGVCAVISPGGSIRDDEVIAACNELGVAMVFTGVRHFRH
jgi:phosphoribosylaminoimidazolecarboxamide formyltransferase / IMP cyclohydrolase